MTQLEKVWYRSKYLIMYLLVTTTLNSVVAIWYYATR